MKTCLKVSAEPSLLELCRKRREARSGISGAEKEKL